MLFTGCSIAPARELVKPESPLALQSADQATECRALWVSESRPPRLKFDPVPYGWVHARFDVENGVVTKVEILDSSPKNTFVADDIALIKNTSFPANATAHGCPWNHKWD